MGLFKKRVADPDEIARLTAEIEAMGARLNATEHDKQQLDTTVRGLVDRLETSTPAPPPPPTTPPTTAEPDTAEIDKLNAKIERLAAQLAGHDSDAASAADPAELERLTTRVDQIGRRLDDADGAPPATGIDPAELARLHDKVDGIGARIAELDQRITSISTELANQITELSDELDAMDGSAAPSGEVVEELRDAQERLAGEQARYQIAFRQDLAELADRLKRA